MRDIRWIRPGAYVRVQGDPMPLGIIVRRANEPYWWRVSFVLSLLGQTEHWTRDVHAAKLMEVKT